MSPSLIGRIRTAIATATGHPIGACEARPVGGGDIHESYVLVALTPYFVKVNTARQIGLFEAEAEALREIAATGAIRVPRPIVWDVWEDASFLVLEHLSLQPQGASHQYRRMGEQLAALHRTRSANGLFGWHRANFIGTTPQPNTWTPNWLDFWRDQRLGFQFKLAEKKGLRLPAAKVSNILDHLDSFFDPDTEIAPSLLHGDLWGGNAAFDDHRHSHGDIDGHGQGQGHPILFDPASYYGDRECDLAFTELFGGFGPAFYEAYDATWPRSPGWERRKDLYNLYHVLNHYNLFGSGYAGQAAALLDRINKIL